jgi:hypothetical protein
VEIFFVGFLGRDINHSQDGEDNSNLEKTKSDITLACYERYSCSETLAGSALNIMYV